VVGSRLALALVIVAASCQTACVPGPQPPPSVPSDTPRPTTEPQTVVPITPTAGLATSPTPTPRTEPREPPITPLPLQTPNPGGLDPRFGIAEGFRDPSVMADIGAGWERVVLSWADIQQYGPGDFSWLGRTLPPESLAGELNRGVRMAGLLQFTATWAATNLDDPGRSVPRNLDLPDNDPRNYWGQFVYETVRYYTGRIDEWIVWNEPEFLPDDAGAGRGSYTWLGTDEQFARLMEVAYRAAKRANPRATVAFPGTSYWVDHNLGRPQFYERYLRLVANNPAARAANFFHDAVPLNLYRAPDDLVRLHQTFKDLQKRYGIDKPMWLLELNAMPSDDRSIACAGVHAANPIQTTQSQQAAYAIQALAVAAAVGYQRIGFYQMVDDDPCNQSAVWGITRDDGSPRPVARSLRTAIRSFSGFVDARFAPLVRAQARWPAWPNDPTSLTPNWQAYQVVFDLPRNRRVTVLWNGDGSPLRVRIPRRAETARLIDAQGDEVRAPTPIGQDWLVDLPPATAHFPLDPPGYYFIGGEPRLLFEDDVPRGAPVVAPRLG
jgi:hypothetical protein